MGAVLVLTGISFLIWGLVRHGPHGHRHGEDHAHDHGHDHPHEHEHSLRKEQPLIKRLAAIAVPFGMAASPDLTILTVALAASAIGTVAVISVLGVFAIFTIATFIALTVIATMAGYQIKGDWLEELRHH